MGEVWRARDTKLGREVAIKTLPEEFAKDEERLARFEREAKLLASLNHPNIAAIYGLEEDNATRFLVLELVEGDTLADRLKRGAIPVEESLKLALQIAEALEAAHEKGVIHRDLKPLNVKVTPDGKVKVLDFGLAKAFAGDGSDVNLSQSPTLSMAATQQGVILGTAAYMSPEQASGAAVDKRADVWAFGCVLFEMLTGKLMFTGETVSHILAAVLRAEPPLETLPVGTPESVHRLLRRCFERQPGRRLRDIGEARFAIEDSLASPSTIDAQEATPTIVLRVWQRPIAAALIVVAAAALSGYVVWRVAIPNSETRTTRFIVPVEGGHEMEGAHIPSLAVSHDGRVLTYVSQGQLFARPLDRLEAIALEGTQGAKAPFFSPDGQWIGFTQDNALKRTSVEGGAVIQVRGTNAVSYAEASWAEDGNIIYRPHGSRVLWHVPADGGTPVTLTTLRDGETFHTSPQVLDGGRQVLYTALGPSAVWSDAEVILEDLETGERGTVAEAGTYGRYVRSGHVLYATVTGTIMVVPYDIERQEVMGDRVPVASGVRVGLWGGAASFAVSDGGTLAYVEGSNAIRTQLSWIDREEQRHRPLGEPLSTSHFELSPDGRQLVADIQGTANGDIFLIDSTSGDRRQFTFSEAFDFSPVWSPEGDRVAYISEDVRSTIDVQNVSEGGGITSLHTGQEDSDLWVSSWSPDGEWLLFVEAPEGQGDVYALNVEDPENIVSIAVTSAAEEYPQFSPDGRWIAYQFDNAGQPEVRVVAFPEVGRPQTVSSLGGEVPRWSPAGDELFFWDNQTLMSSKVLLGESFSREPAQPLFVIPDIQRDGGTGYVVAQDGNEFLIALKNPEWPASEIVVVENWLEELYRDVP